MKRQQAAVLNCNGGMAMATKVRTGEGTAYVGPFVDRTYSRNNFVLKMRFPEGIRTDEETVIYTLWRSGEQCYCNLRLLTNLPEERLKNVLRSLRDQGRVEKHYLARPQWFEEMETNTDEFGPLKLFRLVVD